MSLARSLATLVLLLVGATGCVSNRLDGPIYDAETEGWVRPGWAAAQPTESVAHGSGARAGNVFQLEHRLLLIGDTGLFLEGDPTLAALGEWSADAEASSIVFLGDNIYNEGLVEDDRERGERVLTQLLSSSAAPKVFVPGNHDWGLSPKGQNRQAILNQQAFIDGWTADSAAFLPRDGCMGPSERVLHRAGPGQRDVVLVTVDPTPWINPRLREACPSPETKESFLAALGETLERHAEDYVVVTSHYPMRTGGPHGGLTYGFLGDMITGMLGWAWGGLMNTYEPTYADWISATQAVFRNHPPLAYAAGHDHNLQVLEAGDFARIEIVSGAGARDRVSTVTSIEPTLYAHAVEGFVALDFGRRGGEEVVLLQVIETGAAEPAFEMEVP